MGGGGAGAGVLLESWDPHGPFSHQECSVERVWERVSCVCTCVHVHVCLLSREAGGGQNHCQES